jgi:hypothetical protein
MHAARACRAIGIARACGRRSRARSRGERALSHDLLGDWARMRVLLGEQSLASPADRERAALPRWHRALRLHGQRLLEQSADGCDRWQRAIESLGDGTETESTVIRDVLLESVFLATNASALLERTWPALSANRGRLLNTLLNRFLYVATLPEPRITALMQDEMDEAQWQHFLRMPGGKRIGREYLTLNPTRADKRAGSFKVNLRTGQWADFATGDKGGDAVSLAAYLFGLRQSEAARGIAQALGISGSARRG